jgi:hypothetical protein
MYGDSPDDAVCWFHATEEQRRPRDVDREKRPLVVSLFDLSGEWSKPWRTEFDVVCVDIQRDPAHDVLKLRPETFDNVAVVLAAPPCTHFTVASSRLWKTYDADGRTAASVALVEATLRLIAAWNPALWALENPVSGRLPKLVPEIGAASNWQFHPWMYAGWADDPESEAHSNGTRIWGPATRPVERPVDRWDDNLGHAGKTRQTAISWMSPGPERANRRSKTPSGFARAFYASNRDKALARRNR